MITLRLIGRYTLKCLLKQGRLRLPKIFSALTPGTGSLWRCKSIIVIANLQSPTCIRVCGRLRNDAYSSLGCRTLATEL